MFKKITLTVMGLVVSSFASAGTMGPVCTPGNVTVPCEARQWDLGVQALYLQPIYGANKAFNQVSPTLLGAIKNDWDWGYRLEGSYHFNTGNDASIDWTHFSTDNRQSGFVGIIPFSPFTSSFSLINNNRFDQVNAVLGQHVDLSATNNMRFYGGLQYASIQTNTTNYYPAGFAPLLISSVNFFDKNDFKGVGPIVGIDYAYNIANGLSLTANGSGSLLRGNSRYNAGFLAHPTEVIIASAFRTKAVIVPTLGAKLGVNYAYSMAQGVLNLEGGYQAVNYFNVLQTQFLQNTQGVVNRADYGLYGPYFGVKYLGNA